MRVIGEDREERPGMGLGVGDEDREEILELMFVKSAWVEWPMVVLNRSYKFL